MGSNIGKKQENIIPELTTERVRAEIKQMRIEIAYDLNELKRECPPVTEETLNRVMD